MKNTLRYGLDQLIKLQELQDEEFNKEEGKKEPIRKNSKKKLNFGLTYSNNKYER